MAEPVLGYKIRSTDESRAGIESAKSGLKGFDAQVREVSQGLRLLMGGAALGGVTMAFSRIYQFASQAEESFAKLYPEIQNVAGSVTQFTASVEEMKSSLGKSLSELLTPARIEFEAMFQDWSKKIATTGSDLNRTGEIIGQVARYGIRAFQTLFNVVIDGYRLFIDMQNLLVTLTASVAKILWVPIKQGFDWAIYGIRLAFQEMINFLLQSTERFLQQIGTAINKISFGKLGGGMANLSLGRLDIAGTPPVNPSLLTEWTKIINDGMTKGQEIVKKVITMGQAYIDIWSDVTDKASVKLYDTGTKIADEITNASVWNLAVLNDLTSAIPADTHPEWLDEWIKAIRPTNTTTPKSDAEENFVAPDWLKNLITEFESLALSIRSISMIYNWGKTILMAMFDVIGPLIDDALSPLVGILVIVGQLLGAWLTPVIKALTPVVENLAMVFVDVYNLLLPVFNWLGGQFTILANTMEMVTRVFRFLWDILNWFGAGIAWLLTNLFTNLFGDWGTAPSIDWKKEWKMLTGGPAYEWTPLTRISEEDVNGAGAAAVGSDGGSSYTQGRNITVNVYHYGAVVGSDGFREFALMIRDEIYAAEALGY